MSTFSVVYGVYVSFIIVITPLRKLREASYHWLSVSPVPIGRPVGAGAGLAACISVIDANCVTCAAG